MRTFIAAVVSFGLLAWGGAARAAQLSSPTIYGTFDQVLAECAIINGGPTALAVTVKLVSEFGDTIGPENCGGARLGAGEACSLRTLIDNSTAYACVATAASVTNLRGGLVFHRQVQDQFGVLVFHPIRFAPMR